jgi:hypothetical protein
MAVRLRKPTDIPTPMGGDAADPPPIAITPLAVSGFLVSKTSLVATLGSLVPGLSDIHVLEDGSTFILVVGSPAATSASDPLT